MDDPEFVKKLIHGMAHRLEEMEARLRETESRLAALEKPLS